MAFKCPRCGRETEQLIAIDTFRYIYKGPLTRVCPACREKMEQGGDLIPSGTAARLAHVRGVTDQQRRELAQVRLKQWIVRAVVALVAAAAGWWAWRRYLR